MAGRFPKLEEGMFPNIANVEVMGEESFDYDRYSKLSRRISLRSVPWPSDYSDVVAFEGKAARDEWLDSKPSKRLDLGTQVQRVPSQAVRVPLPFNAACAYNYATLDLPVLTGSGAEVDYESRAMERICFFIEDIAYVTPSVTELSLILDVWQTYSYDVDVTSMMLERGHAPMRAVDAETYLKDPHANCTLLTARDVDFSGRADDVRHAETVDLSRGDKLLALALPIDPDGLASVSGGTVAEGSAPTFYDIDQRNGYQLGVRGYAWAPTGYEYQDTSIPVASSSGNGSLYDQCRLYAVAGEQAASFISDLSNRAPQVLASAAFAAVLPSALAKGSETVRFLGYSLQLLEPVNRIKRTFDLDKADWGYPADIADQAKLYTYPYSFIELSDDDGTAHEIRIEDIEGSALDIDIAVSLSSLALKVRSFPSNVGASGGLTLAWKTLDGARDAFFPNADVISRLIEWDVPTYSLEMLSGRLRAAQDADAIAREREDALLAYRQAVRPANTSHQNTLDADATSRANQARTNATSTANTDASNTTSTANTALSNQARTDAKDANNTTRDSVSSTQNYTLTNNTLAATEASTDRKDAANKLQAASTDATNDATSISGMVNAGSQLMGGAMSLAAGDVMGVIGAAAGAVGTTITTLNAITKNQTISEAIEEANFMSSAISNTEASDMLDIATAHNNTVTGYVNGNATDQANISNAHDTQRTENDNALASTTTANNNALGTANTNATTATSDANSGYSRGDSITAAQENLIAAQARATARYANMDSQLSRAGSSSAFSDLDAFDMRALRVRVRTQDKGAIRSAGDHFKRYGYALDAAWDFESWAVGDYSYWKCKELKLKGEVPSMAIAAIREIASRGFTAWREPERIGIYE